MNWTLTIFETQVSLEDEGGSPCTQSRFFFEFGRMIWLH